MSMGEAMLLAGDIGGTKTLLGLFEPTRLRPRRVAGRTFGTLDFADLSTMIAAFLKDDAVKDTSMTSACFGVAGPVMGDVAELTNVPWRVDARLVAAAFNLTRVDLLNDLQAMAASVPVLDGSEVHVLQNGRAAPGGNIAVIAAGTGLGEASLQHVEGRFIPVASEGGHADFAARTERDIVLLRDLIRRYGRAEVEHVVSGPGLVNIAHVTHRDRCEVPVDLESPDAPAAVSTAALERRCPACVEALDLFIEAYGAEAGNLALRTVSTGGVFVGGGIAPKILPAITSGKFIRAFSHKAPLQRMLETMPVKVILNAEAGLLGAAVFAARRENPK